MSGFLTPASANLRAQRRHRIKIKNLTITLAAGVKFAYKKDKEKAVPTRIATIMALSECNPEVLDMRPSQSTDATEKRRQLLKGALGASTVVSLGYSGTAAAASITCIAKRTTSPDVQFSISQEPPAEPELEWMSVTVFEYSKKENLTPPHQYYCQIQVDDITKYYKVTSGVLSMTATDQSVVDALYPTGHSSQAWVLRYFDPVTGEEIGTYPTYSSPSTEGAPASIKCLESVTAANVRSGGGFGG